MNVPAENDPNFDSGWQDSPLYVVTNLEEGTTYTFRTQARDKSEFQNATMWSPEVTFTTASGVDNLPPTPARWGSFPREVSLGYRERHIAMGAARSYDENGVEYFFDCVYAADNRDTNNVIVLDPNLYDSGWISQTDYTVKVVQGRRS